MSDTIMVGSDEGSLSEALIDLRGVTHTFANSLHRNKCLT